MRILGIETSCRRGSIAIIERGEPVYAGQYEVPSGHAERLLPLLEQVLAEAGFGRTSVDGIAVGTGPGTFTGLRVGIAFAQGLAIGLGRPLAGVGSLLSMSHAVPAAVPGLRCPVLDARREELFVAVYDESGTERRAPVAIAKASAAAWLPAASEAPLVLLGEAAAAIEGAEPYRSPEADLPHATHTALVAAGWAEPYPPAEPLYIRAVDAIRPNLPPSPLSSEARKS